MKIKFDPCNEKGAKAEKNCKLKFHVGYPKFSEKPIRIDTVSFDDATPDEMLQFFTKHIEELTDATKLISKRNDELQTAITELKESPGALERVKKELSDTRAVLKYVEDKLDICTGNSRYDY